MRFPLKDLTIQQKEEREVLYSLKDDPSILMKDADKGSAVLVLDRKDYLMEAFRKLDERV